MKCKATRCRYFIKGSLKDWCGREGQQEIDDNGKCIWYKE